MTRVQDPAAPIKVRVAGVSHRGEAIAEVKAEGATTATIVPDPHRAHGDVNALKVVISGRVCGYVPEKMCDRVRPGEAMVASINNWAEDSWSIVVLAPRA